MSSQAQRDLQQMTEEVYGFLCQFITEHGFSPSLREIGASCFIGRSTVQRHLDRLEAQGHIAREIGQPRTIRLLNPNICPEL